MELTGKVAIVTGGASGIGRAIAGALCSAGAAVVIADVAGAVRAASELAAEAGSSRRQGSVMGIGTDVASEASVLDMADQVCERLGGIDVLVNNAALFAQTTEGPFEQIPTEEWRRVLEVNVLGPYLCAKAVVASMRDRGGGCILNIASGTVFKGVAHRLHYVTSKGAVVAFTRSLARELGGDGIRVNAIAPGFTLSEGVRANRSSFAASIRDAPRSRSLQRDQVPGDVAGAARFLCGPGAGFITGQTLVVDGGSAFH